MVGGDGRTMARVSLDGALNGTRGAFEWTIEKGGVVNHRFFSPS